VVLGHTALLVLLQPDVELEAERREGEDCCLPPQLPELCGNHLSLATRGRCSTKKTRPGCCGISSIRSLGDEMMTLIASFCS